MRKVIYISIIFLFLTPVAAFTQGQTKGYCSIDPEKSFWAAWEKCDGKRVKVTGKMAEFAMQHPTGLHDRFDPETTEFKKQHEAYLELNDAQIVLTSSEKITCSDAIEVEGLVDLVDLGGEEGTKSGYKNIWIKVRSYQCK